MILRNDALDVKEKEINQRQNFTIPLLRSKSASLKRRVNSVRLRQRQQFFRKSELRHRLASGNRHAASGIFIKRLVFCDFRENLFRTPGFAAKFKSLIKTDLCARAAADAMRTIELVNAVFQLVAFPRTRRDARAASGALAGCEQNLGFRIPGFRIVAPETAQGTALQENRRPDARSVVHAELLNVKYGSLDHHIASVVRSMTLFCISSPSVMNVAEKPETRTRRLLYSSGFAFAAIRSSRETWFS